jgi:acetylornithine deacetylase
MGAAGVEAILTELIRIDSVNTRLAADGGGEAEIAAWIERFCDEHGLDHAIQLVEGCGPNVLAWVPGREDAIRLLFVAHLDTVPVVGFEGEPFAARRVGRRLYGRGACDTKGSLAAMLQAVATIRKERPRATVVVAGSADEEYRKAGARALAGQRPRFEAAVVGEPTQLEPVVAHKGSVRWSIETRGRAAHTSKPELGVNAITGMARVISAIDALAGELRARPHPLVGPPTLTISLIEGGVHVCVVPDRCRVTIDRRLVPGERPTQALDEVEAVLETVRRRHPEIEVRSILPATEDPPLGSGTTPRIADVARRACDDVAGRGEFKGVPYGTDASQLAPAGIPCVVVGPGSIDQAHTVDEYVDMDQVEQAVEIYRRIMLGY